MNCSNYSEPVFIKLVDDLFYFLDTGAFPDAVSNYLVAFMPLDSSQDNRLKLSDTWEKHDGIYLFMKGEKKGISQKDISNGLLSMLKEISFTELRFIWLENPLDLPVNWNFSYLSLAEKFVEGGKTLAKTGKLVYIDFRNYALSIQPGCKLGLNVTNIGFLLSKPQDSQDAVCLITGSGAYTVSGVGGGVEIPFCGGSIGCLCFSLSLAARNEGEGFSDLQKMDIGLRFYFDDPYYPTYGFLKSLQYPVFENNEAFALNAFLDPLNHLDPNRTFLAFNDDGQPASKAIRSYYRTNSGRRVLLLPGTGKDEKSIPPTLVFAVKPGTSVPTDKDPYTLVPSGDFSVSVEGGSTTGVNRLMCGISGIEYVGLSSQNTNIMRFFPGQCAYAESYLPPDPGKVGEDDDSITSSKLKDTATTSWVYITNTGADGVVYYAQPEKSALYRPVKPGSDFLDFFEVSAGNLKISSAAVENSFPLLPYGGINQGSLSDYTDFEVKVMNPKRRDVIYRINASFDGPGAGDGENAAGSEGVTPQGLKAVFDGAGAWKKLVLAHRDDDSYIITQQSLDSLAKVQGMTQDLISKLDGKAAILYIDLKSFENDISGVIGRQAYDTFRAQILQYCSFSNDLWLSNLKSAVRAAFQTNRVFMVVSSPDKFLANCSIPCLITDQSLDELLKNVYLDFLTDLPKKDNKLDGLMTQEEINKLKSLFKKYLIDFFVGAEPDGVFEKLFKELQQLHKALFDKLTPYKETIESLFHDYQDIVAGLKGIRNRLFDSVDEYGNTLDTLYTKPSSKEYCSRRREYFNSCAGFFNINIGDWHFDLSPYKWKQHGTILIFKYFNGRSVKELVKDTAMWTLGTDLNDDLNGIQSTIAEIIKNAESTRRSNKTTDRESSGKDAGSDLGSAEDFAYFSYAVGKEYWEGVLALNCFVPLDRLPPQIEGIAAGIDPNKFYCHHLGINLTPIHLDGNRPIMEKSSSFGLIYYSDEGHLSSVEDDYLFKVNSLSVLFNNSQVARFASSAELLVNELFDENCSLNEPETGNNILFDGYYQRHDGQESYMYINRKDNMFSFGKSSVLDRVEITRARFVTLPPSGDVGEALSMVNTCFLFQGRLYFKELPDFDLFSFGDTTVKQGLSFSNLSVDMSFDPEVPSEKEFNFDAVKVNLDMAASTERPGSLYAHFPLKLKKFMSAKEGDKPEDMDYMPVDTPLTGSLVTYPWYGLQFELNMGSLGALAAKASFVAEFLAAWSPDDRGCKVFVGLKMPGVHEGKREINIENVIKLTFGDVNFIANKTSYILQLRNIALHLFCLTFPPHGETDLLLFGDPEQKDRETLGWYAAYMKK